MRSRTNDEAWSAAVAGRSSEQTLRNHYARRVADLAGERMNGEANTSEILLDRDEIFKLWLARSCFWGAASFMLLSILDYYALPDRFAEFLWYRAYVVVALSMLMFVSRTYLRQSLTFHEHLGRLALIASAATIELMILRSGGHESPYYVGQILLGVYVLGFIPARIGYHAGNVLILYAIYVIPILVLDRIVNEQAFITANGFMVAVLLTVLIMRVLSEGMIDRELRLREELARSRQEYRDLFEHAMVPMFLVDRSYRFRDANRKAEELTGFTRSELCTMSILDMIPREQVPRSLETLAKVHADGGYERFSGRMRTKDGRVLDVEVSSSSVRIDGDIAGSCDIVQDVSERVRNQEEVRKSRMELEQRVQERTTALTDLNAVLKNEVTVRRKAEQTIVEQLERQRALSKVERSIASSLNLSVTLNIFIEQVMSQLRPDAASVMLYDRSSQELSFAAAQGFRSNRIMRVTVRTGHSLAGTVIARQNRLLIPDLEQGSSLLPSPEGYQFKNAFMVKDEGFRAYIGVPLTAKGTVQGILEVFHRRPFEPGDDWLEFLDALSQQAAIAIDNASLYQQLQRSHAEISMAYDKTIEGWSRALDIRDNETHGHSQRVADLAVLVARRLGINDGELVHIRRGALLHDIGKLGVPDSILGKPGQLTAEEMAVMKRHPEIAYDILSPIPFLKDALDIPYLHHEKWDGTGYPHGLRGMDIPVPARIFAVIDVWDALRSDRPYRPAWEEQRVREHLKRERERHFDPEIVEVFFATIGSNGT